MSYGNFDPFDPFEAFYEVGRRMADFDRVGAENTQRVRDEKREEIISEARRGAGAFWPRGEWKLPTEAPKFDGDQECRIMVAVRDSVGAIGLTSSERYEKIFEAVMKEIESYADCVVDK